MDRIDPPLTLEQFRSKASELLLVISKSRAPHDYDAYVGHWGRFFELLRAARSAGLPANLHDRGPWATMSPDNAGPDIQLWLVGGTLRLPIRVPKKLEKGDAQLATDLPRILNGAEVQPPPPLP